MKQRKDGLKRKERERKVARITAELFIKNAPGKMPLVRQQ